LAKLFLPPAFEFGVATSAYQIEGAWNLEGKGRSIWDTYTHTPGKVDGDVPGDFAADHFHRFAEDIALMRDLGVDSYRLSLSWARLIPDGVGAINQSGVDFYNRLIDGLLEAGIAPNITLYHWDLPQALEDRGGWPNREIASWFGDYAATAFDLFGDRVKRWATINEPIALWVGYALGWFAPGYTDEKLGRQAMHNAMLAHGTAVERYRASRNADGEIGIVLDIWKREPLTDSAEDRDLADRGEDDGFRFFLDALRGGGYSARLRSRLEAEGTLPEIHPEDQALIEQPIDYLGVNVYNRVVVNSKNHDPGVWAASDPHPGGNFLDSGAEYYPKAVYDALKMVEKDYGWTGPIFITENGVPDPPVSDAYDPLDDQERIRYVEGFLEWIATAVAEGADVRGYYLWSLLDNYEWSAAFTLKYGLIQIDPITFDRTPKASFNWYRNVIADHKAG
jgi:beta-glucosidase